jgi:hypothetical protein
MFSGTAQASHQIFSVFLVSFFVSSVCLLVRVTTVDKNKAVLCCLLVTSAIMLSEKKKRKRKIWSKKWCLKRNISCDAHLLNELLETDVPWDDAFVVSAGKLRKLWDSLSELRSSVCEKWLKMTVLRPALLLVKTAQFTQFFRQVWRHTVKSLSLTESVWGSQKVADGNGKIKSIEESLAWWRSAVVINTAGRVSKTTPPALFF